MELEFTERDLIDGLIAAISDLPGSHARYSASEARLPGHRWAADAILDAYVGQQGLQLVVEAKRELFPRDIHHSIWQLRGYMEQLPGDAERLPVMVAGIISQGARDLLKEEGVGYYDSGGTLYLPARNAYILIDRPPPKKKKKVVEAIFQGQRARVLQAMFERADEWVGVNALAAEIEVSPATVSETLSDMERRDWVDVEGAGPAKTRRLRNRSDLVDAWTQVLRDRKPASIERYYVPVSNPFDLAHRIDRVCRDTGTSYAVTGEFAAQLYSPYLSQISQLRCRIEPGRGRQHLLSEIDARPVAEGWNLGLIAVRTARDIQIGERLNEIACAPPLQIYLDLLQGTGRAKDMAAHLREEVLQA